MQQNSPILVLTAILLFCILNLPRISYASDKIKIGVANYNLSNLSVGVAQKRGFFKEEGLDSEIIPANQRRHRGIGEWRTGLFYPDRFDRRCGGKRKPAQ